MLLYMILNATEAVYRCLPFSRGKNGENVRILAMSQSWFYPISFFRSFRATLLSIRGDENLPGSRTGRGEVQGVTILLRYRLFKDLYYLSLSVVRTTEVR